MISPSPWVTFGRTLAALTAAAQISACGGSDDASPDAAAVARTCDTASVAAISIANAEVKTAAAVAAGAYAPIPGGSALQNLPAFCKVTGVAMPTSDSLINFEVWVPTGSAWNGKFVTTGNGGYSPALSYSDMAYAMRQGYAVMGGDTGHQTSPNDMLFGVGHPEKIIDWGTRSIHAITGPGKRIVTELQAKAPTRSYYYGCSTGGHQGYAEAQRYPQDFDGIIAGAPGNNRTALNVEFMWRFMANHPTGVNTNPILTSAKATLVTNAAVAACDAVDGVTDGVIADPRQCTADRFNVDALQCTGADAANCLTAPQVAAVKKIYAGPKNPRTNTQIYPGQLVGSESGWPAYWGSTEPTRADFWRYWVFDNPQYNWWTFDFDRDFAYALAKVGGMVDQNSTDLSAFKARGGKLLVYHGWIDPVVSPVDTIAYYDRVKAVQGSQTEIDRFFRVFMVPGMGHCGGGPGATVFGNSGIAPPTLTPSHDILSALDHWVEQGVAPDSLIASRLANGVVTQTRPICAYPKKPTYKGSGSTDDAANFSCS